MNTGIDINRHPIQAVSVRLSLKAKYPNKAEKTDSRRKTKLAI